MKPDNIIIKACLSGDQLAYKQLYERYLAYTYGICNRYLISQSDNKDVIQIIFSQAFKSLPRFDSEKASFKTWFTHISINNILTFKRNKAKSYDTQQLDDMDGVFEGNLDNSISEHIDKEYILSLLAQMPSQYQHVFNMYVIDGYSHDEISTTLQITPASSRVILNRARGWVKKTLVNHLIS